MNRRALWIDYRAHAICMPALMKTGYSPVNERIAHNNAFEMLDGFKLLIANCYHLLFYCQTRTQIDTKYVAWQHRNSEIFRKKSILGINNKKFPFPQHKPSCKKNAFKYLPNLHA